MPYWNYNIDLNTDISTNSSIYKYINQITCFLNKPYLNFSNIINQLYLKSNKQNDNLWKILQFTQPGFFELNATNFNINNNILQLFMIISLDIGITSSNSGIKFF